MTGFAHRWKDFDLYILVTTVVLMSFGAVTIWSADEGGPIRLGNDGVRQGLYGVLGLTLIGTLLPAPDKRGDDEPPVGHPLAVDEAGVT